MQQTIADHTHPLPYRSWEVQSSRARAILLIAGQLSQSEEQFALEVSALHLARAIPDYWYTTAGLVALDARLSGRETRELADELSRNLEKIFSQARHYKMLDALRRWDFHWEPLKDPKNYSPKCIIRRGSPMKLTTGSAPGSSAGMIGLEPFFSGSGRRIGRGNYYDIRDSAFFDEDCSKTLPLALAVLEFLEDIPRCVEAALSIPQIRSYFEHPMRLPPPGPITD